MKINKLMVALLALGGVQLVAAFAEMADNQEKAFSNAVAVQEPVQIGVAAPVATSAAATRKELQQQLAAIGREIRKINAEFAPQRAAAIAPINQEIQALYAKQRAVLQPIEAELKAKIAPLLEQQMQVRAALGQYINKFPHVLKQPAYKKWGGKQPWFVGGNTVAPQAPEFATSNAITSNAIPSTEMVK